MSKTLHRSLEAKMAAAHDSSALQWKHDDDESQSETSETEESASGKHKKHKSNKKQGRHGKQADSASSSSTTLYLGHLPPDMEESDWKTFLEQFGEVLNIRISRSISTGRSRGYGFCRMESVETARIVADTLEGYFLGGRRLVCHTVDIVDKQGEDEEEERFVKRLFYDTDKVIQKRIQQTKLEDRQRQRNLCNRDKLKVITSKLVARERKKRAKLVALGIDYDFPGYEASSAPTNIAKEQEKNEEKETEQTLTTKKSKKKRKESIEDNDEEGKGNSRRSSSIGSESSASKKSKKAKTSKKAPSSERKAKKGSTATRKSRRSL